jgi:hypothetical protein
MTLEIFRESDKKWVKFYPIVSHDFAGEGYTFDTRPLAELDENVYGRFAGGVAGYNVWWMYGTYPKYQLREMKVN